jgi:hypothetical protein
MNELQGISEVASSGVEIARGISEFGMLAVAAAFFILLSAVQQVMNYRMQRSLFRRLLEKSDTGSKELEETMSEIKDYLKTIADEASLRSLDALKKIAAIEFELSTEKVCNIIANIQADNHIHDNEDAVTAKLRRLLVNIHKDRVNFFSSFRYNGNHLSGYINPDWAESVYEVAHQELYDEIINPKRTRSSVKAVYDEIRIEFISNMISKRSFNEA